MVNQPTIRLTIFLATPFFNTFGMEGSFVAQGDHYVIARRTRETLRSTLVKPMSDLLDKGGATGGSSVLEKVAKRLKEGQKCWRHRVFASQPRPVI